MASNCPILFTHPFSPIYIFYSVTISPGYKKTVKTIVLLEGERVMEGEWGSPLQSPRVTKNQNHNEKKHLYMGGGGVGGSSGRLV